jgi:hypothetical protein
MKSRQINYGVTGRDWIALVEKFSAIGGVSVYTKVFIEKLSSAKI